MLLTDLISQKDVFYLSNTTSKKRLFQDISKHFSQILEIDNSHIFSCFQEREQLGHTGMGKGIAIPHARIENIKNIRGMFIKLEKPIEFDSLDKQPVDLIFALVAPRKDSTEHLKTLAKVSRLLKNNDVCEKLRSNEDSLALFSILVEELEYKAA